jgi:acetyltransferase-like isoleucine patch superfamily enzyme
MRSPLRTLQRHFLPQFIKSLVFLMRDHCFISTQADVQLTRLIRVGRGTTVKAFSVIQTSGGNVRIGDDCAFNNSVHVSTNHGRVVIGNKVRVGPGAVLMGSSRRFRDPDVPIVDQGYDNPGLIIGDDVLIGAHATIIGCEIGRGAVIGANSVVKRDVEPYSIVAGTPARVIAYRAGHPAWSPTQSRQPATRSLQ